MQIFALSKIVFQLIDKPPCRCLPEFISIKFTLTLIDFKKSGSQLDDLLFKADIGHFDIRNLVLESQDQTDQFFVSNWCLTAFFRGLRWITILLPANFFSDLLDQLKCLVGRVGPFGNNIEALKKTIDVPFHLPNPP